MEAEPAHVAMTSVGKSLEEAPLEPLVREVVSEAGRSEEEAAAILQLLERDWITRVGHWQQCGARVSSVPQGFAAALTRKVEAMRTELNRTEPEKLMDLADLPEESDEDRAQNAMYAGRASGSLLTRLVLSIRELVQSLEANGDGRKRVVKLFLNKLENFSTADWTIDFDIGVQMWWCEEEHVGHAAGDPNYEVVWKPDLEFIGARDVTQMVCPDTGGSYYIRERYRRWGIVNWYQRYRGTLHVPLDLHNFPFDTQTIRVRFGSTLWGAEDVLLVNRTDPKLLPAFDSTVDALHEWKLDGPGKIDEKLIWTDEDCRDISYLEYVVPVRRLTAFYSINVFGSVFFLNVMMWGLFLLDAAELADRLNLCTTYFLALVAFSFVVAETLPKISHSTYLTYFWTINYATVTASALESILVNMLEKGAWQLPLAGLTVREVDVLCLFCVAACQSGVMLWYVWLARRHKFKAAVPSQVKAKKE